MIFNKILYFYFITWNIQDIRFLIIFGDKHICTILPGCSTLYKEHVVAAMMVYLETLGTEDSSRKHSGILWSRMANFCFKPKGKREREIFIYIHIYTQWCGSGSGIQEVFFMVGNNVFFKVWNDLEINLVIDFRWVG